MEAVNIAKRVFQSEIRTLETAERQLDRTFEKILERIMDCQGKVILIGMGKSGHVAKKIAASMASLGTCAVCLHPGECMHGDLGMIQKKDLVIAISYSGESDEIAGIIPNIKLIGAELVGLTCNSNSTLARQSDLVQVFSEVKEACHLGLAPTNSTTLVMVYGDALAVAASEMKGFDRKDFALFHPAGSLGKKLMVRVRDLMTPVEGKSVLHSGDVFSKAIMALGKAGTDIIPIADTQDCLIGILTDGEISRALEKQVDIYKESVDPFVRRYPLFADVDMMATDALKIMLDNSLSALPAVRDDKAVGILAQKEILKAGIYI